MGVGVAERPYTFLFTCPGLEFGSCGIRPWDPGVGVGEKVPPNPCVGLALSSPRQAWETGVQMNTGCELAGPASAQFN